MMPTQGSALARRDGMSAGGGGEPRHEARRARQFGLVIAPRMALVVGVRADDAEKVIREFSPHWSALEMGGFGAQFRPSEAHITLVMAG